MNADQAPKRTIVDVEFTDEQGRPKFPGFDLKHKNAFGVKNLTMAERTRLEKADPSKGQSLLELASNYNERKHCDMVEVTMPTFPCANVLSVPYFTVAQQVSNKKDSVSMIFISLGLFVCLSLGQEQHAGAHEARGRSRGIMQGSQHSHACGI